MSDAYKVKGKALGKSKMSVVFAMSLTAGTVGTYMSQPFVKFICLPILKRPQNFAKSPSYFCPI